MRTENLFNKNNNSHIYVTTLAAHFADVLEGFHIVISHKARMTQAPVLLLRGLFETIVRLLYLADGILKSERCFKTRFDSILLTDICERTKLDNDIKIVFSNLSDGAGQKNLKIEKEKLIRTGIKIVSIPIMLDAINKDAKKQCYFIYRKLSETAHPNIEGMRSILDFDDKKITLFNRSDNDTLMWLECAANFTDGALQALKQLLTPVRTEPVEINMNPSTSSGRTGVV
jgi:hypothetical protein